MRKKKILFISVVNPGFVRQDEAYFREKFDVRSYVFGTPKGYRMIFRQLHLFFWLLRNIWGARFVYMWFADYHAVLPAFFARLFGKKLFVVLAGYDCAKLPQYHYGVFSRKFRGKLVKYATGKATKLFPLSDFLVEQLETNTGRKYAQKSLVVAQGAPVGMFSTDPAVQRDGSVICVSKSEDLNRMKIKGLDFYAEVARACPEVPFILVGAFGPTAEYLAKQQIPNLTVYGFTDREKLQELYNRASVICQFSRYEGFGMVLLEGMLCECVPVSIDGIGPAEVIDEATGFLIPEMEVDAAARAVQAAIESQAEMGPKARQKVLEQFTFEHRMEKIMPVLEKK